MDRWKKDLGRAHSLVGKYSKHGRIQAVTGHRSKNNFDLDVRGSKKVLVKECDICGKSKINVESYRSDTFQGVREANNED